MAPKNRWLEDEIFPFGTRLPGRCCYVSFRECTPFLSIGIYTLPETNITAENGWLEYDPFLLGSRPIFKGELLVSGRVYICARV